MVFVSDYDGTGYSFTATGQFLPDGSISGEIETSSGQVGPFTAVGPSVQECIPCRTVEWFESNY